MVDFLYGPTDSSADSAMADTTASVIPITRGSAPTRKEYPLRLVVIGGGAAGACLAKQLASGKYFDITLIDTLPYFENKLAMLQLLDSSMESTIAVASQSSRHDEYLKTAIAAGKARVVVGTVKDVSQESVILEDDTIPYDYLVVAGGRDYSWDAKKHTSWSVRGLGELGMHLKRKEAIVIIGGGTVGVETALSIRALYPSKRITIVEASKRLLSRCPMPARAAVKQHLSTLNIEVICSETAVFDGEDVVLSPSGRRFAAESWLGINCVPGVPRTQFLEKSFAQYLDPNRYVVVNEFFQIGGRPNMFAAGDCVSLKEEKMAERALVHADLIAEHLKLLAKGRPLSKRYRPPLHPPLQVIPLGSKRAIAIWGEETKEVTGSEAKKLQSVVNNALLKRIKSSSNLKVRRGTNTKPHVRSSSSSSTISTASSTLQKISFESKSLVLNPENRIGRSVARRLASVLETSLVRIAVLQSSNNKTVRRFCDGLGTEVLEYSWDNPHSLSFAMKGIKIVYLPLVLAPDAVKDVRKIVSAAKAAGVTKLVVSIEGALHCEEDKSTLGEWAQECESVITHSGIGCVSIRTSLSLASLATFQARNVRLSRALRLPFNDALRIAWVHPTDIAKVAVHKILDTEPVQIAPRRPGSPPASPGSAPKQVIELTGPVAVSCQEIAALLASALGETVYYISIVPEAEKAFWCDAGMSEELAAAYASLNSVVRCGSMTLPTTSFAELLPSEKPSTPEEWIRENVHDFL